MLSARGFPDFPLSIVVSFYTVVNVLIIYWGLYVFFMALGVSDDWIDQSITKRCYTLAKCLFIAGIGTMCGVAAIVIVSYLFPTFVSTTLGLVVLWALACCLAIAVALKLAL